MLMYGSKDNIQEIIVTLFGFLDENGNKFRIFSQEVVAWAVCWNWFWLATACNVSCKNNETMVIEEYMRIWTRSLGGWAEVRDTV